MSKTRTTHRLAAAAALSALAFAGLAGVAAADTPPFQGGGGVIVAPAPQPEPEPQPEPQVPTPDLPIAQPMPEPEPHPQPGPQASDDLTSASESDPEPEPQVPTGGNGDITDDPCNHLTHGCGEDDTIDDFTDGDGGDDPGQPDGHCFDDAGNVADVAECIPGEDDGDESTDTPEDGGDEPKHEDRGALPRTGAAGLGLLAGLGATLLGGGAAAKRFARR